MSSHNEQIKPRQFDVNDKTRLGSDSPALHNDSPKSSRWVLPLLVSLVVIAGLVVFWLPARINQLPVTSQAASATVTSTLTPVRASVDQPREEASPWTDAQMAKMRKQAQDVLTSLLEAQDILEEIGVEQWAAEAFSMATATAAAGDAEYRERQFIAARASYEQALEEMQVLLNKAPLVLAENLLQARQAIDKGDGETANAALLIASSIEPENVELLKLSQRASNLEQLLSLLAQAEEAESTGRLLLAQSTLQQAVSLDSASQKARSELARVTMAYIKQRFNEAMSNGYISLDKDQFALARIAFKKAAGLMVGSAVAASALNDVNAAETANRLVDLQRSGLIFETQEQWAAALAAYTDALQIDDSLLFARQGLKRSKSRALLDQQFLSVIEQPERLSEQAVADATAQLLRQARMITPRGPVLQQQLEQLETVLEMANTPIQVILRSDMETDVTVRKVARLGRFKQRQLELRPGTYVAVGTREGYRDVRRTFSIHHDSEPPTVIIACTEQI